MIDSILVKSREARYVCMFVRVLLMMIIMSLTNDDDNEFLMMMMVFDPLVPGW